MSADEKFPYRREFSSTMSAIQSATDFLSGILSSNASKLQDNVLYEIRLAVTEVYANIVEHSYRNRADQSVEFAINLPLDAIEMRFTDRGNRPPPHLLRGRELTDYRERGLGLFLITRCMDETHFDFREDGVNTLYLYRRLQARVDGFVKIAHFPFYTANYERGDTATLCLIGSYIGAQRHELHPEKYRHISRLCLHLGLLEEISAESRIQIERFVRELKYFGAEVTVTRPPQAVLSELRRSDLSELTGDQEFVELDPAAVFQNEIPLVSRRGELLAGQILPLIRVSVPRTDHAKKTWARLHPGAVKTEHYEVTSAMRWSDPSNGMFVRVLSAPGDGHPIIFAGLSSIFGDESFAGLASLYAMIGCYAELVRSSPNFGDLGKFIDFLSRMTRTLSPKATSDEDGARPMLVVVDFRPGRMTVCSGNDREIIREGGNSYSAIAIGTSELTIHKPAVIPFTSHRARFFLGFPDAWNPSVFSLESSPCEPFDSVRDKLFALANPARDVGILDVTLRTK